MLLRRDKKLVTLIAKAVVSKNLYCLSVEIFGVVKRDNTQIMQRYTEREEVIGTGDDGDFVPRK